MPKTEIDYSNTIIYKITCKDSNITDVYVGHTTNFVQRKHAHKQCCINIKSLNYKCKVYEVIRHNGGWDNWTMEIINFFNCSDHYEARKKEQEYFVSLNATLNSIEPMPPPKITSVKVTQNKINNTTFYCKTCNIHCNTLKLFETHNNTNKHNKNIGMINNILPKFPEGEMLVNQFQKIPATFECNKCNYNTSSKKDFEKHTATVKHKRLVNASTPPSPQSCDSISSPLPTQNNGKFICCCGKFYCHDSSYYRHKKKCGIIKCKDELITCINDSTKQQQLIDYLLKENAEFKQLMIDQNKQLIELAKNSGNNNTTNNNNNFNLNFFLNETCKNAMNIKDFVSQLQVGIKELEDTGRLGFAEGISKIFINGLKNMEINDRPIHCSDSKREVVYIKDNDQWNKDTEDKPLLINAIKQVARKNIKQISEWTKDNPEYKDSTSKQNDKYLMIVSEAMSGSTIEESNKNYNKIIKNIANETMIDK